jgi:hypothetical protein
MSSGVPMEEMPRDEPELLRLRFQGVAPVSVHGPVTDVLYRFSQQCPVQAVDARDAQPILSTRLFRRVP